MAGSYRGLNAVKAAHYAYADFSLWRESLSLYFESLNWLVQSRLTAIMFVASIPRSGCEVYLPSKITKYFCYQKLEFTWVHLMEIIRILSQISPNSIPGWLDLLDCEYQRTLKTVAEACAPTPLQGLYEDHELGIIQWLRQPAQFIQIEEQLSRIRPSTSSSR